MPEVRIDQLSARIRRGLDPVYLLTGDEPLLIEEALDTLRERARSEGFAEREVLHADKGFDWRRLADAADSLSLFSERRLIELRLPGGRPGKEGGAALRDYVARPSADRVLVVICGRLEPAQRKSAWVNALADAGVVSHAWPLRREALPEWIAQRAGERGLNLADDAIALLAEQNEGNLLALAQEIDKLVLLADGERLDAARIRAAISDGARFAVFDLPEAVLAGDVARAVRITRRLRAEGEEPVLVLWALARDLRVLAELQREAGAGADAAAILQRHRIWKNRQARYRALARQAPADAWPALLARAAGADRAVKGAVPRRAWDELIELVGAAARTAAGEDYTGRSPCR